MPNDPVMIQLRLVRPSAKYLDSFVEALQEGNFTHMALDGFGDISVCDLKKDPRSYLKDLNNSLPRLVVTPNGEKFVLNNHYIRWVVSSSAKFLAGVAIRKDKGNPIIERYSGNAGLCVRSGARNQGYGTKIWSLILREFEQSEFTCIRVSASPDNIASRKCIEKAGGKKIFSAASFGYHAVDFYEISVLVKT